MKKRLGFRGAAIAATLFALTATAAAQGYPPPPPGGGPGGAPPAAQPAHNPLQDERGFWQRRGLYGGVGLGFGTMTWDCDFCEEESFESIGFHFNIGFKLNPQLGIFLDGWGLGHALDTIDDAVLVHAVSTVGVQFWAMPQLHVKAGLGGAQWSISSDTAEESSETRPAFLLAGGYEILSSPRFSVDVDARLGVGLYDEDVDGGTITNFGIQFSVNWHSLWGGAVIVVH